MEDTDISTGECAEAIEMYLNEIPDGGLEALDFEDAVMIMTGVQECLAKTSSTAFAYLVTAALVGQGDQADEEFYEVYRLVRSAQKCEGRTKQLKARFEVTHRQKRNFVDNYPGQPT